MSIEIINVVGGGALGREVDLQNLYKDINSVVTEYDPEVFPGIIFRLTEPTATVMLFRSGKYNLAGAKSHRAGKEAASNFIGLIDSILEDINKCNFKIRYIVCTASIGSKLDLNQVVLTLGTDRTEYEPEQFPGVFYRPEKKEWFAIIFSTGSVVLNGGPEIEIIEEAFEHIQSKVAVVK